MSSSDSENRFWAVLVIAVPCLAFGGFEFLRTLRFVSYAEVAHGVVVSASERGNGQYVTFKGYPEVITFSDSYGNVHTTTLYYGQPGRHPLGSTVKLLYKKHDPAGTVRFGDAGQLWVVSNAFLLIGAIWLAGAFKVRRDGY